MRHWVASGIAESITTATGGTLWCLTAFGEQEYGHAAREGFIHLGYDTPLVARQNKRCAPAHTPAQYSAAAAVRGVGRGGSGAAQPGRVSTGGE